MVNRAIVNHDHLLSEAAALFVQRLQAFVKQVLSIVRDDENGDVGGRSNQVDDPGRFGRGFIGRAGIPAQIMFAGRSRVTTDPAPTMQPSPIVTPAVTTALAPIQTPSRITTSRSFLGWKAGGVPSIKP